VLLEKRGVAVCSGVATLKGPGSVVVEGSDGTTTIESDNVILATGSGPLVPKSFPYDGRIVVTSKEVLSAPTVPESVLIVGAGSVGCEFAGFYASLGAKVVLVEMLPDLLPGEDRTASRLLKASFAKQGIDVHLGAKVESIEQRSGKAMTSLSDGKDVETDLVLLAMGRRPASDGSGIAESGVATEHGAVVVNDRMETSVEGVYAIGDLVGGWLLAHVASREGVVAAAQAAGRDVRMSYRAVPRCTFTRPEIASVGVTEDQAKERGLKFDTGRFPFSASGRALAAGENQGFVKLVSDSEGGKVIGGVIAGPHAGDLIHEITLAVECGLSVTDLSEMIHAHPTFAESVMEAAESVRGLSIHSM
jgi:dihydrolipoamide dehydrogenase